jgi:anti-sigma factor RsiW
MRCKEVQEVLMDRVSGRLDPERAKEVDMHTETCPECRRARDEFSFLRDLLALKKEELLLPDDYGDRLWEGIMKKLGEKEERKGFWRVPSFALVPAMAALVLLISTAVLYVAYMKPEKVGRAPSTATAPSEIPKVEKAIVGVQKGVSVKRGSPVRARVARAKVAKGIVRAERIEERGKGYEVQPSSGEQDLEVFPVVMVSGAALFSYQEGEGQDEQGFPMGSLTPDVLNL